MAERKGTAAQLGATPGKLVLIGVLGFVFLFVLYWNYFRSASDEADASAGETASASEQPGEAAPADSRPKTQAATDQKPGQMPQPVLTIVQKPWPKFQLRDVIAYDPFAIPKAFPQPDPPQVASESADDPTSEVARQAVALAKKRAETLATIKQRGVDLVYRSGEEYVAKIGEKQVKIGDSIDGFRVVDISLNGVILEGEGSP